MKDTCFIYSLHDPRIPESVRYVGVTHDLKGRFISHCSHSHNKGNRPVQIWISSLLNAGLKPVMVVIDKSNYEERITWEKHHILLKRLQGHNLTNSKPTGPPPKTEETRLKISASKKGMVSPNKGKKASDETRAKMSLKRKGTVYKIVTCPHCGKSGGKPAMIRYHFNNCKLKIPLP